MLKNCNISTKIQGTCANVFEWLNPNLFKSILAITKVQNVIFGHLNCLSDYAMLSDKWTVTE